MNLDHAGLLFVVNVKGIASPLAESGPEKGKALPGTATVCRAMERSTKLARHIGARPRIKGGRVIKLVSSSTLRWHLSSRLTCGAIPHSVTFGLLVVDMCKGHANFSRSFKTGARSLDGECIIKWKP
jgi:hypothetical protein